ncbi:NAD-dependent epimerase/dehydratase family protein [Oleomonas cavernae]|uniref:NAD-dependent epimerase/dehydratase family protein n=1 Tax=Oleomonas cavernae TaxID=2320859 RepID=A0A418WIF9_9PROT|nr:SDR family oxidoreductase [Oleomonas cavernae]RJF89770.1 NAD-dependent epimerase/dehydratase family protein [Oleomonas cavernae]
MTKTILMTGITGLIGRWTAARLTADGHKVLGLVRNAKAREAEFKAWVVSHGGIAAQLELIEGDLALPGLGLAQRDRSRLAQARHIYHLGALMDWSDDRVRMHRVNVEATVDLLALARSIEGFERFVHISGYLVTAGAFWRSLGFERDKLVEDEGAAQKAFRILRKRGAVYENSKIEADILVRRAARQGLPAVIVNPSSVIGHAKTGEAHQMFGIEGLIQGISNGSMSAIPGKVGDWVPLLTVDYLAAFLARAPMLPWSAGQDFTVLHQGTPDLARVISIIAEELGKKAPRHHVPLWLLRPLLKAGLDRKTGTPAQALAFINAYRFDTSAAERAAIEIGLAHPDIEQALRQSIRYFTSQPALRRA